MIKQEKKKKNFSLVNPLSKLNNQRTKLPQSPKQKTVLETENNLCQKHQIKKSSLINKRPVPRQTSIKRL